MRNLARGSSAQTANSGSGGNNPEKAMAAIPGCAIGFESGRLLCGLGRRCLGPHLENIHAMFDAENPGRSGGLAGESYASVLENHPRYPSMRRARDAELIALLDRTVEQNIKRFATLLLPPLGFDEAGIAVYRSSALSAFRAALPTN
jgi:hypothetical protein